jgi:hypothetical protein
MLNAKGISSKRCYADVRLKKRRTTLNILRTWTILTKLNQNGVSYIILYNYIVCDYFFDLLDAPEDKRCESEDAADDELPSPEPVSKAFSTHNINF